MKLKNILVILALIFLSLFFSAEDLSSAQDYKSHCIIVKFRQGSRICGIWQNNGRNGEIEELTPLLGRNNTKSFICGALLDILRNEKSNNYLLAPKSDYNNLSRICIVNYDNDIDPKLAAAKLRNNDFIEYAEVMPLHSLFYVPNDPKYSLQYYLNNIKATDAWDLMDSNSVILAGIVDTGVEYTHDDLKDNIFENPGESGTDSSGESKRDNGIDDDNNGFIDDWHGWDFTSGDSSGQDNDPFPGHRHGTHLAGTIGAKINNDTGIAGIVPYVRILPVKVAGDDPNSTSVSNGYEGILYASLMKCDVINCSWGSSTRSEAEQEVINTAFSRGSAIVAAAGNEGKKISYYPAAYRGVMSVAAVGETDMRAYFSNYERTVDVSAPGDGIYASVSGNWYDFMDGTSMASPVAAGVAGLVKAKHPDYNPLQVIELVKKTTDNIDSVNPGMKYMMGTGRVNALKAVTDSNAKSIVMTDYKIADNNKNNLLEANEEFEISVSFTNILSAVKDVKAYISSSSNYKPTAISSIMELGNLGIMETITPSEKFKLRIPESLPADYSILLKIDIIEGEDSLNTEFIEIVANPSYRNMTDNNIHTTINSIGNIGYNDYPNNYQGIGLSYKNSPDILFEGALLAGTSSKKVSNVARDGNQNEKDESFSATSIIRLFSVDSLNATVGEAIYKDEVSEDEAGVSVKQLVYQFKDNENSNFIITSYDVSNISGNNVDSLFVGLFFDWDIGPSGNYNVADYDFNEDFGFQRNIKTDSLPWVGVKLLSQHKLNYFAIDNNGSGGENPGIYSGFSNAKKWFMLSSGLRRTRSNITDASQMISAGPIRLRKGDTTRVVFSIFAASSLPELEKTSRQVVLTSEKYKLSDAFLVPLPDYDKITSCYPNPADNTSTITIDFAITQSTGVTLEIYDLLGKRVNILIKGEYYTKGAYFATMNLDKLSQGVMLAKLTTQQGVSVFPFIVTR